MEGPLDPDGDVSVVIVAYRSPDVLAECLGSFEQHRPARVLEVIVIDNSADDSCRPVAERFPWADYVANAENTHFRAGTNQAARRARGRYLFLLNPDAYLTDSASIALLADVLDRRPEIGFVGPTIRGDDGLLAPQGEPIAGIRELVAMKARLGGIRRTRRDLPPATSGPIPTATAAALLIRRADFLGAGGLDERARAYWEEHELARKLSSRGLHGYYCSEAFVFHHWRRGGTQLAGPGVNREEFERAMELYYRQAYGVGGSALLAVLNLPGRLAGLLR